jgi:hypothetical protein
LLYGLLTKRTTYAGDRYVWKGYVEDCGVPNIMGQGSWLAGGFLHEVKAAEEERKHSAANVCIVSPIN